MDRPGDKSGDLNQDPVESPVDVDQSMSGRVLDFGEEEDLKREYVLQIENDHYKKWT